MGKVYTVGLIFKLPAALLKQFLEIFVRCVGPLRHKCLLTNIQVSAC
jgi:hypothetical protein